MRVRNKNRRGQNTSEVVVLLPFFLLLVFGLLQLGQLAAALIVANYAASAIARQAVQDGSAQNRGDYTTRFRSLLAVGMKSSTANVLVERDPNSGSSGLMGNVKVHACAEIDAYPFVGQLLGKAIAAGLSAGSAANCGDNMPPFAFTNTAPAFFVVHGWSTARMNYQP